MKRIAPVFLLMMFAGLLSLQAQSSAPKWKNFTSYNDVTSILEVGDNTWIGTKNGLVMVDNATGERTYYNKGTDGLPSNLIEAIVTDDDNNIWIGTYDAGIAMLDNGQWKSFNSSNSGMESNKVFCMTSDLEGNIWVGTDSGPVVVDDGMLTSFSLSSMGRDEVWAMTTAEDGRVWAATLFSIYAYDGKQWTEYGEDLNVYGLNCIKSDPSGAVYAAGGGFFKYDGTEWKSVDGGELNTDLRSVKSMILGDEPGELWMALGRNYLLHYKNDVLEKVMVDEKDQTLFINRLYENSKGEIMAGTRTGIAHQVNGNWKFYSLNDDGFNVSYTYGLATSADGTVWVATYTDLLRYNGEKWETVEKPVENMNLGLIYSMESDAPGSMWMAGINGLYHVQNDEWTIYNNKAGNFPSDYVYDIDFGKDGSVWVAHKTGLSILKDGEWKHISKPASMDDTEYMSEVTLSPDGSQAWIGTGKRVYLTDGEAFTEFSHDQGTFPGGYVYDIVYDREGVAWACTWGGGVCWFDGKKWNEDSTLSEGHIVKALAVAKDNTLWAAASYPHALYGGDKRFDHKNSILPDASINDLAYDANGNLWIATSQGMTVYNEMGINNSHSNISPSAYAELSLSSYPNPAGDNITISYQLDEAARVNISIIDLNGKLVYSSQPRMQQPGRVQTSVDVSTLPAGIYMYQVQTGRHASAPQKLVVY